MASLRALSALAFACVLACAAGTRAHAACSKPLTMVAEEWPPYSYTDVDGQQVGLDIALARAIVADAGCTLSILPAVPPLRRTQMFEQGKIDLLLAATDRPARRRVGRFTAPYRNETVGMFTLASHAAAYRTVDSFDAADALGLSVLAPRVGWYGTAYARHVPALRAAGRLFEYGTIEQGMRMLSAERAQLIIGDVVAINDAASRARLNLHQLPVALHSAPVHLLLSRASTTAADQAALDVAIARLDQAGVLQTIRARYGLH